MTRVHVWQSALMYYYRVFLLYEYFFFRSAEWKVFRALFVSLPSDYSLILNNNNNTKYVLTPSTPAAVAGKITTIQTCKRDNITMLMLLLL